MKFLLALVSVLVLLCSCDKNNQSLEITQDGESEPNISLDQGQDGVKPVATKKALPEEVKHYLSTYCYDCHNDKKQKGDRRLDILTADYDDRENLILLEDVLDQLNLGEMPPQKKNIKQPDEAETKKMVEWLTATLVSVEAKHLKQATVMRRLNLVEYKNLSFHSH